MRIAVVVTVISLAACRSLDLPEPPGPVLPGTVSGRTVVAVPGRPAPVSAGGAEVALLESGQGTTADATGAFRLEGIRKEAGTLLFRFDSDGDGTFDKQKVLSLEALKAGPGKDVSLGDVVLVENAQLRGKVLRSDVSTTAGHAGTLVFVPEGPFTALSADDGSYLFTDLPAGTLNVSFFRAGYVSQGVAEVQLTAGQTLTLRDLALEPQPGATPPPATVTGRVMTSAGQPVTDARLMLIASTGQETTASTDTDGAFRFSVEPQVYSLRLTAGATSGVVLRNVLLLPGARDLGDLIIDHLVTTTGGGAGGGGGAMMPIDAGADDAGAPSDAGTSDAGPSDAGFELDAGGATDAGGFDAGVIDAGPMDAPDAGSDAGSPVDAGAPTDAGALDAGGADAGSGSDAGLQLATPPVAVTPAATVVRVGATNARLDGTGSFDPLDAGPLLFEWTEESDAGIVLSANNSLLAQTPTFTAPASPTTLRFSLRVTNQRGLTSAPASTQVEVRHPPQAHVMPTSLLMKVGTTAVLSAATSTDASGSPLSFTWSVVSGAVALSSTTGPAVTVTAPGAPGAATVRVVVSTVALSAEPLEVPIVIDAVGSTVATVTLAPLTQVVGLGAPVVISASATSSNAAETFTYSWVRTSGPVVSLSGDTTSVLGFTAPMTSASMSYQVTATGSAGASGVAVASVNVEDRTPPQLVSSDPIDAVGAAGGWYALTATFDEPLDPSTVTTSTVKLWQGSIEQPIDVEWLAAPRTIRATPRVPLVSGQAYTFVLGALMDASAAHNLFPGRTIAFNARSPRFTAWGLPQGPHPYSMCPGISVSSTETWVQYTNSTNNPRTTRPELSDGGVQADISFGSQSTCSENRHGFVVNDTPVLNLAASGQRVWQRATSTSWGYITITGYEKAVATDGTKLVGLGENYGPHWATYGGIGVSPVDDFFDNYTSQGWATATGEAGFALALSGQTQFVAVPLSGSRLFRAYLKPPGGSWALLTGSAPLPGPVQQARATMLGTTPVLCFTHLPGSGKVLQCSAWNGTAWVHALDLGPGTVENFDVFTRGSTVWLSYAAGGQLKVKALQLVSGVWTVADVPGPGGAAAWNTPSCTAANPEAFASADSLTLVWEENCSSGWVVRLLRAE
ncbi:MAG: carboxypeptidase regulatory-like domain-containing protein [Archangium sp.]|nr:carboxypeptidase regulatory-like domain-containing protein [Archangium sp.]